MPYDGGTMRALSLLFALAPLTFAGCENGATTTATPFTCTPGATIEVGCNSSSSCGGMGSCTGDPVLAVCDGIYGVSSCASGTGQIATNDDCSGLCPYLSAICPASGRMVVSARAFRSGSAFTCNWRARGPGIAGAGGGSGGANGVLNLAPDSGL